MFTDLSKLTSQPCLFHLACPRRKHRFQWKLTEKRKPSTASRGSHGVYADGHCHDSLIFFARTFKSALRSAPPYGQHCKLIRCVGGRFGKRHVREPNNCVSPHEITLKCPYFPFVFIPRVLGVRRAAARKKNDAITSICQLWTRRIGIGTSKNTFYYRLRWLEVLSNQNGFFAFGGR